MDRTRPARCSPSHATSILSSRAALAFALLAFLAVLPGIAHALVPACSATAPPGWSAPVVPRATGDAVDSLAVTAPPVLVGGAATYLDWASLGNPAAMGGWTDQLSLDGTVIETLVRPLDTRWITHYFRAVNQGPTVIGGGRHTLAEEVDVFRTSGESSNSHGDNTWSGQWVWSPATLNWGQTYGFAAPPSRGTGAFPNCDGFAITRANGAAWCVALASAGDDDLLLYDDVVDATHGFSHVFAGSASGADSIELLVGQAAGTPATFYPGLVSGTAGASASCVFSTSDAASRSGDATTNWPDMTLPGARIAEAYVVHLEAGVPVGMSVRYYLGGTPLACAVFPAGSGQVFTRAQALTTVTVSLGQESALGFTAPVTGDYPVVVYRTSASDVGAAFGYNLAFAPTLGAPAPVTTVSLELLGATPNPVRDAARFAFSLPSGGRVTLALHDVQGRRVRTLVDATLPAGAHAAAWDGRDDAGAKVPAGAYWMRLETAAGTRTQAVTVAR